MAGEVVGPLVDPAFLGVPEAPADTGDGGEEGVGFGDGGGVAFGAALPEKGVPFEGEGGATGRGAGVEGEELEAVLAVGGLPLDGGGDGWYGLGWEGERRFGGGRFR